MHLTDFINVDDIVTDFQADGKAEALEVLCALAGARHGLDPQKLLDVVWARENRGSTGLGGGVALPHGKSPDISRPVLAAAVARFGVEFNSLDGAPVRIFVLIITPADGDGREHLQILARLGGLFSSKSVVDEILGAAGPAEVYNVLAKRDL